MGTRAFLRAAARPIYHSLLGATPPDPVRAWGGTARPGLRTLRVLHVGDCGLRAMDRSHDFRAPLGFPRVAAERLAREGAGIEFRHHFCTLFEDLPAIETLRTHGFGRAAPDVILVQLGASYARRVVLPDTRGILRLRVDIARRSGRLVFAWSRMIRPLVNVLGRYEHPYPGPKPLERFLRTLRAEWPDADVVVLQPFLGARSYPSQVPIRARTRADVHGAAERAGVAELDFADLLGADLSLRGANSYNLNTRGSELVGEALARWLAEESRALRADEPVPAAAAS